MLIGIFPMVENACSFKEGSLNPNCAVEESTPIEDLSGSLQSCEPFSFTDKDPCKSLVLPDISGTEVLVGAFNSISIVESSRQSDVEGNGKVICDDVSVVKFPDTSCSDPSWRSTLTAKSNQKTQTRNTARKRGKTVVQPLLDSVLLRVARKRRSYLCKPARSDVWGSLGYIAQVFEKNQNGRKKTRKARGVRGSGKRNKNHSQCAKGKSCDSSGRIRLKVTVGRDLIQNCLTNMVSITDNGLRNYWGTNIDVLKSTEGSENKMKVEVPGISRYQPGDQDQEEVGMSSDAAHLGFCLLNKALEIPMTDEKSVGVDADNHQFLSSQVVVDNRYLDSGTSPDSEVINLIPEAQVNGKVKEDLYDVLSSSQACVAPGDVTNLDVSQISNKKAKKKNKLPHADNSSVADRLRFPEIINNAIVLEIRGHEEKMGDVFYSSEPSMSTTIADLSGNTSSSEEFSRGPLSSSGGTDYGVPFENFKIEDGTEDRHFRCGVGVQSLGFNTCDKLHPYTKTKGRKHLQTSKPIGMSKTGSEASDSPRSQKGNAVKSERRRKDKGACGEVTYKVENHPETGFVGDHSSADSGKVKNGNESTTKDVFDLDMVPKCVGEHCLPPQRAWVCCDACLKWRRIPATLADFINETNSRWICQDNVDKGFADCTIPQEMSNSEINAELQISDASCGEDASDARWNSKRLEPKHSTVQPQSSWVLIKSNLFLHRTRKRQTIDEIMVCHCKPPPYGRMGCGDGCLNRMLNIECVRGTCPCGELCSNQQFQKRKYTNLNRVRCGKKGYGLETQEDITEGRFLIEYVGEVLDLQAYEARQREYASMGHKHFYFMTLNGSEVIDACAKGNLGRFINHSCDPNCRTEKWMVNGEVCIGLFALRDIKKGEELTFDYNYVRVFGAAAKECVCGSSQCRGYLGGDPQNTEAIVKGDSDEEYPEPVMFYEDGEIDDNCKHLISTASSGTDMQADHTLGNKDKIDKSANVRGQLESIRELQIAGIQTKEEDETDKSATAVPHLEITTENSLNKYASGAQLRNSLEMDNSVERLLPGQQEETCSQLDDKSNKTISEAHQEFVQGLDSSLQAVTSKPLSDAIITKKKVKSGTEDMRESKSRTRLKTSRSSSLVKKGKLCSNSLEFDKSDLMVNKSVVLPYKSRKMMESSLNDRFEAVEEKLNELLDADGGISKRKDATRGYLKLLLLTATSGDSGNGEAIQSNRDLSMILDALLKTRSKSVLGDIVNKNGLQMLHNIMKRYRRNFNKIPILRKLLKVLEYLAVKKILTLEHINGGPRCLGVERKMSSSTSSNLGSSTNSSVPSSTPSNTLEEDDSAPLWKYVTKIAKRGEGGSENNTKFKCNYCTMDFNGSYFRVKAHLLLIKNQGIRACSYVKSNANVLFELKKLDEEAENRKRMAKPKNIPLPPSSFQFNATARAGTENVGGFRLEGYEPRKRKAAANSPIEKAMNLAARETLHAMIARMFYSAGLPFHLARNPYFVAAFQFAAENNIPGYVPPGYNLLRTSLLQKERANIERLLAPTKKSWNEKGVSIVADGWTDAQRRPLINFMGASDGGAVFMRAVNCEGETKDKNFIANLLGQVIHEVGPQIVVQVITDNAPVCSAAGAIIEGIYPKIFWTPCVVHTLNLAMRNICAPKVTGVSGFAYDECLWIKDVIEDVMFVKNFIMNHSMRLAIFNEFVPLKLLSVADTRFASSIVMLKRFKLISRGLQAMVISERWSSYKEDDVGKAASVKEKVLSDVWWDKIDYILSFTLPIYEMLRFCDTDKPCLHLVYEMWDSMIEKVKATIYRHEAKLENEESTFYSVVHKILVERWTKSSTPLHCLAHSLNPSFRKSILTLTEHDDKQVHQIARNFRDRWFPRPVRKSSCMDRSDARVEFLWDSKRNRSSPSYTHGRNKVDKTDEAISSIKQSVLASNSDDTGTLEGCSASGTSSFPTQGPKTRKRKSRWDQPGDINTDLLSTRHKQPETQSSLLQKLHAVPQTELRINGEDKLKVENREHDVGQNIDEDGPPGFLPDMGQKIDKDVPPGFSVLSNTASIATDIRPKIVIPSKFPFEVVTGHPNGRFNNRLAISYGIPLQVVQRYGIPQEETLESWIVAPGMPFQPFPPLPPYPCDKRGLPPPYIHDQVTENIGEQICHSDQSTTPSTSGGARIPLDVQIQGANSRHTFQQRNGTHILGRKYFRQQKWNTQVGPPWIQKRNGPGFMVNNNSRNGMCSSVGVVTVVNEVNGQSEYVNPGVQNASHTFHQYPQQQNYH